MHKSSMKKLAAAILLFVSQEALAFVGDGNQLAEEAKGYLSNEDMLHWGVYFGKVTGVASVWMHPSSGEYAICYPGNATAGQLAKITAKYLDDNPAELHKSANYLIWASHLEAFGLQSSAACDSYDAWILENR